MRRCCPLPLRVVPLRWRASRRESARPAETRFAPAPARREPAKRQLKPGRYRNQLRARRGSVSRRLVRATHRCPSADASSRDPPPPLAPPPLAPPSLAPPPRASVPPPALPLSWARALLAPARAWVPPRRGRPLRLLRHRPPRPHRWRL